MLKTSGDFPKDLNAPAPSLRNVLLVTATRSGNDLTEIAVEYYYGYPQQLIGKLAEACMGIWSENIVNDSYENNLMVIDELIDYHQDKEFNSDYLMAIHQNAKEFENFNRYMQKFIEDNDILIEDRLIEFVQKSIDNLSALEEGKTSVFRAVYKPERKNIGVYFASDSEAFAWLANNEHNAKKALLALDGDAAVVDFLKTRGRDLLPKELSAEAKKKIITKIEKAVFENSKAFPAATTLLNATENSLGSR